VEQRSIVAGCSLRLRGGLEAVFAAVSWWRQREDVETVLCSPFSDKDKAASMVDDAVVQLLPWLLLRDIGANLSRCNDEDGDSMVELRCRREWRRQREEAGTVLLRLLRREWRLPWRVVMVAKIRVRFHV